MPEKYEYLIYNQINSETCRRHTSFHMPGHKAAQDFSRLFPEAAMDITELSFSDNLHCPTGAIYRAQRDIAEILGARASYITTDGSTSGVFAMLYAAAKRGGKVIIPRNAHRSVYNACRLFNLEPIILQGEERRGVYLAPKPEKIEEILKNDGAVAAVIAVSPDYYGNFAPLERYAYLTKKYNRLLLVDGAHGAHLAFERNKKGYCGAYADMWVDGAHKTLPTLTQGAVLNIASDEFKDVAEEALAMFRTTSPSYPIMASVEYGVKYLANNPEIYNRAKAFAAEFKSGLSGFEFYPSDDWSKLAIDFKPLGISPELAAAELEKNDIYAEMCDGRYILFYLSPMTERAAFEKLADVLQNLRKTGQLSGTYKEGRALPETKRACGYLSAFSQPWEYVPLESAAGRVSCEDVGVTPPCIPVVAAGEVYTPSAVEVLKSGKDTFGIKNNHVKVVKK